MIQQQIRSKSINYLKKGLKKVALLPMLKSLSVPPMLPNIAYGLFHSRANMQI